MGTSQIFPGLNHDDWPVGAVESVGLASAPLAAMQQALGIIKE